MIFKYVVIMKGSNGRYIIILLCISEIGIAIIPRKEIVSYFRGGAETKLTSNFGFYF